ncbi:F-box domain-containing protein [Heracleum sosnowskyi]|uniref:F-box domain-containing protein n=1 Tax=Heracleum sosnowskyi TaxID=360622 RepID=A0AAD8GX04_9APIA|nr:F-box domain-containing protein [Heracleum sosnowskyi]
MPLPYELIYDEILCRLPVKYLLRYRCVSKEWCSIIDSKAFVKKHLKKAIECNPDGDGVIITGDGQTGQYYLTNLECLYADEDVAVTELDDPLKNVLSSALFVGAANCLACFCKNNMKEFIILNPSTRKYKKVPSMPSEFAWLFEKNEVFPCGFGYDHVNDDYKVVKIVEFIGGGMIFMIYSMKSNCWTWLENVPSNIRLLTMTGMFTSGALNWLAKSLEFNHKFIVGFDLGLEQFMEVPFPIVSGNASVPSRGTLCFFDHCINSRMNVWMINNYGAENPWYKAFSVERSGVLGSFELIRPVAFSKSGKDVLLDMDNTKLVWYDPKRNVVKNVVHGIPTRSGLHLYRESLLELKTEQVQKPSSEDKKEKKERKKRDDFLSKGFKLKL